MRIITRAVLGAALTAALSAAAPVFAAEGGIGDATVIAVIDSGVNPYHWDNLASKMPQNTNGATADDLPLDRPASEWLPGFDQSAFESFERKELTLEQTDETRPSDELRAEDADTWAELERSSSSAIKGYWFPGTKVIAGLTFARNRSLLGSNTAHGVGTTSSAVGNLHGTCPECLLVFIQYGDQAGAEAAIEWAESQPWIDAISNSYGFSDYVGRDRIYTGSDTAKQRDATLRGQTILFSSGNGVANDFITPNLTTFSSQEGPDWIITVGAVTPPTDGHYGSTTLGQTTGEEPGPYVGAGKPADVAGVGSKYPTSYSASSVGGTGTRGFGGTSNATPQTAGLLGRSLWLARRALEGPSRVQQDGVVARGPAVTCGAANPACELGDGVLTRRELQTRLFQGARHEGGLSIPGLGVTNEGAPPIGEEMLLAEGYGHYLGRVRRGDAWRAESEQTVFGPMVGAVAPLARPAGEREWFVVDSYCRQENWGSWTAGDYVDGQTPLPGPSPAAPVRTAREQACPGGPTGLPKP